MGWGWQRYPVNRLRPALVADGHGNLRPDWDAAQAASVGTWLYAPSTQANENLDAREHGVQVAGNLYGPPDADVLPGDAVQFQAGRFRVVGEPQTWRPGTVLEIERWDG